MRHRNTNWNCGPIEEITMERAQLAVLQDIRDELRGLNRLLNCPNFTGIPKTLERIRKNTVKPRGKKI